MTWEYLAGFFDGEGYCRSSCTRHTWQVTQKDRQVLDEIAKFLQQQGFHPSFVQNKTNGCWSLRLYRVMEVKTVLVKLHPLLIVKRGQAEAVIDAIDNRPSARLTKPMASYKKGAKLE